MQLAVPLHDRGDCKEPSMQALMVALLEWESEKNHCMLVLSVPLIVLHSERLGILTFSINVKLH